MRALPLAASLLLVSTAAFARHPHTLTFHQQMGHDCVVSIFGTSGNDTLGSATNTCIEIVQGNGGDDTLIGGTQGDVLHGGPGHDVMTGNGGADVFAFDHTTDTDLINPDVVTDFHIINDKIDLTGACADAGVTCTFIGNSAFTNTPGEVSFSVASLWWCDPSGCRDVDMTIVAIDFDGDGVADVDINLLGRLNLLGSSNFVL